MANEVHLEILRQGVKIWNHWREEQPDIVPNLSEASLSGIDLAGANLTEARLTMAFLFKANLNGANLKGASLSEANLTEADLSEANLSGARLVRARLIAADFSNSDLSGARLDRADLFNANFSNANLSGADLSESIVLKTDFTRANLTGACIADWQISNSTKLDEVTCEYIYRTLDDKGCFSSRLPVDPGTTFAAGEFTRRFQILASALETIDLTFTEGIDWQAFFTSFQRLQAQYSDSGLSIQGMERKAEGFVVKLEVNEAADKAAIETQIKRLYVEQLQALEAQYEERLRLQGTHLEDIRDLLHSERQERTRLSKVVETMANEQQIPKYDLRGAQFAGGFAEAVYGNQIGGVINNYGQSAEDVVRLLATLREKAQGFPTEHKDDVLDLLDDLEADIQQPQPDSGRIGRKLKRLVAIGTAATALVSGATAVSGNLNDFTKNVFELTERLGMSVELVQPSQGKP